MLAYRDLDRTRLRGEVRHVVGGQILSIVVRIKELEPYFDLGIQQDVKMSRVGVVMHQNKSDNIGLGLLVKVLCPLNTMINNWVVTTVLDEKGQQRQPVNTDEEGAVETCDQRRGAQAPMMIGRRRVIETTQAEAAKAIMWWRA